MLREENDAALAANDNLRQDVVELTRALEHLEQSQRDDRDRFKTENSVSSQKTNLFILLLLCREDRALASYARHLQGKNTK